MKKRINDEYAKKNEKYVIVLQLFAFVEEHTHHLYSPALDLFGYGDTEQEAEESFSIVLEEFVRYTTNKGTLRKELERLGWSVKNNNRNNKRLNISSPPFEQLMENVNISEIINNNECKTKTANTPSMELV